MRVPRKRVSKLHAPMSTPDNFPQHSSLLKRSSAIKNLKSRVGQQNFRNYCEGVQNQVLTSPKGFRGYLGGWCPNILHNPKWFAPDIAGPDATLLQGVRVILAIIANPAPFSQKTRRGAASIRQFLERRPSLPQESPPETARCRRGLPEVRVLPTNTGLDRREALSPGVQLSGRRAHEDKSPGSRYSAPPILAFAADLRACP